MLNVYTVIFELLAGIDCSLKRGKNHTTDTVVFKVCKHRQMF